MKRLVTLAAVCVVALAGAPASAQSKAKAQNVPEIPYDSVPNFFKLPPNLYFGEAIGIATNSKGHVFVYTRSGETTVASSTRTASSFARNRSRIVQVSCSPTPCASTRTTTSRLWTKGQHGDQVQPAGPRRADDRPSSRSGGRTDQLYRTRLGTADRTNRTIV